MGCGASKKSLPYDHQYILSDQSANNHSSKDTDDQHPNNMLRKEKPSGDKKESTSTDDLEQKLRKIPSIPEDDIKEALSLASKHPELHDEFIHLVNIMHDVVRNNPQEFVEQLCDIQGPSHLIDFFALIGGAKITVQMYTEQLKSLDVTHLTDKLLADDSERNEKPIYVISRMRVFWIDATDLSSELALRFMETELLPYLAEDVKHLDKDFADDNPIFDESVTILHNCARFRGTKQYFRNIDAVQLLTPFLTKKEKGVKMLTLLTLSYIIDEEDNDLLLADDCDFDFLLENVTDAWEKENHRTSDGYSLEELLLGLGNLAKNDENKKLLMKKGAIEHLRPILKGGSDAEKQVAVKVVWELAFDKENRAKMENDVELIEQLKKLKRSSHNGVLEASCGVLWVLNMDKRVSKEHHGLGDASVMSSQAPPPPPPSSRKGGPIPLAPPPPSAPPPLQPSSQGHIMISYQWANQKLLLQVRDNLQSRGFTVWMDVDHMTGSTLEAMAEAVEKSAAVLMCMSERYKESPNCRTEAEYAFQLQKPIIPLLMERNYKPDGWLGILKGSKLFFDFTGKYPYQKKLDELVKELERKGLSGVSEVDGPIVAEKAVAVARPPVMDIGDWSQKDVLNWLSKHQLNGCPKLQSLSGENLKFLQKLSQRAPEFYFTYLKQDLGLTSLNDLMHFSDAIDKLQ